MTLTVNFARADHSFVNVSLPYLVKVTPYPYSVVPCTRKPPRSEMSSPEAVLWLQSFACVSVPILASSENAGNRRTCATCPSQPTLLDDLGAVI